MQSNLGSNVMKSTETSTSSDGLLSSVEIRKCNIADVPLICALGRDFHRYSPWATYDWDESAVETLVSSLINGAGVVFTNGTGFICGMLTPLFFSPRSLVGTELAWWAPAGGGFELREAFEDWCRENGAKTVQFSALPDKELESVNRNFTANGFRLAELSYIKVL